MANTLTSLIPDAFLAADHISRELVGFIPGVTRDSTADAVAANQTLRIPYTAANTASGNITPGMSFVTAANQTIANKSLTITKQRFAPFSWENEERYSIQQGPGILTLNQQQIAQAMRVLVNEMETDIANAAYLGASRAYGTAATTPFASDLAASANVRKILDDNGAPTDRSLVLNTSAGASLRTLLNNPTNSNNSLNVDLTRQGVLLDSNGLVIRESAQVPTVTAGAMASATTNNAGYAIGATALTLALAGTGVVAAGDIVTFAGDTNKYVITSVVFAGANPAAGDIITIAQPGLRVAMSAATKAITVIATAARNIAFSRNAILFASRLPMSDQNDISTLKESITDPKSGMSFQIVAWPGTDMVTYHVRACWGVTVIKPEHVAVLLG